MSFLEFAFCSSLYDSLPNCTFRKTSEGDFWYHFSRMVYLIILANGGMEVFPVQGLEGRWGLTRKFSPYVVHYISIRWNCRNPFPDSPPANFLAFPISSTCHLHLSIERRSWATSSAKRAEGQTNNNSLPGKIWRSAILTNTAQAGHLQAACSAHLQKPVYSPILRMSEVVS